MDGKKVRIGACLLVGNVEKMVQFYRDILGFHTDWTGGNFAEFETASGRTTLFIYSRKEFVKAIGRAYRPPRGLIRPVKSPCGCPRSMMWTKSMSGSPRWAFPSPAARRPHLISASAISM